MKSTVKCAVRITRHAAFRATDHAATRAKVKRFQPGDTFDVQGYEFTVDMDEWEDKVVVQTSFLTDLLRKWIKGIAKLEGIDVGAMDEAEWEKFNEDIKAHLMEILSKDHEIVMKIGYETIVLEKAAYHPGDDCKRRSI